MTTAWSSAGPLLAVVLIGFAFGFRKAWRGASLVLAFMAVLHLLHNKQYRFVMVVTPLLLSVAGIGLARLLAPAAVRRWSRTVLFPLVMVAVVVSAGYKIATQTYSDLGWTWDNPDDADNALRRSSSDAANRAMLAVGRAPDLCGLALFPGTGGLTKIGGYSYLHRNVPVFYELENRPAATAWQEVTNSANYAILDLESVEQDHFRQYVNTAVFGNIGVFRREGPCDSAPARFLWSKPFTKKQLLDGGFKPAPRRSGTTGHSNISEVFSSNGAGSAGAGTFSFQVGTNPKYSFDFDEKWSLKDIVDRVNQSGQPVIASLIRAKGGGYQIMIRDTLPAVADGGLLDGGAAAAGGSVDLQR